MSTVPEGFLQTLKDSSILELAVLRRELKASPEDGAFLAAVEAEIKRRAQQDSQRADRPTS